MRNLTLREGRGENASLSRQGPLKVCGGGWIIQWSSKFFINQVCLWGFIWPKWCFCKRVSKNLVFLLETATTLVLTHFTNLPDEFKILTSLLREIQGQADISNFVQTALSNVSNFSQNPGHFLFSCGTGCVLQKGIWMNESGFYNFLSVVHNE